MVAPGHRRLAPLVLLLALTGCLANTEGTGKGSGKETGGCVEGIFCEAGLQCVYGYCVAADEDTGMEIGDEAGTTGDTTTDTTTTSDTSDTVTTSDTTTTDTTTDTTTTDTTDTTGGPVCGNGVIDMGEECDGNNIGGASCMGIGYDMGTPGCMGDCTLDYSTCSNIPQPNSGLYSDCLMHSE
ncbi:MAG: hypothetical protein KC431_08015, partial [Myxococcales bacterium]|nr:hypothetical protein [Myxococcales bacterium]